MSVDIYIHYVGLLDVSVNIYEHLSKGLYYACCTAVMFEIEISRYM